MCRSWNLQRGLEGGAHLIDSGLWNRRGGGGGCYWHRCKVTGPVHWEKLRIDPGKIDFHVVSVHMENHHIIKISNINKMRFISVSLCRRDDRASQNHGNKILNVFSCLKVQTMVSCVWMNEPVHVVNLVLISWWFYYQQTCKLIFLLLPKKAKTHGTKTTSLVCWPSLWSVGPVCGLLAQSVVCWPSLWSEAPFTPVIIFLTKLKCLNQTR